MSGLSDLLEIKERELETLRAEVKRYRAALEKIDERIGCAGGRPTDIERDVQAIAREALEGR